METTQISCNHLQTTSEPWYTQTFEFNVKVAAGPQTLHEDAVRGGRLKVEGDIRAGLSWDRLEVEGGGWAAERGCVPVVPFKKQKKIQQVLLSCDFEAESVKDGKWKTHDPPDI